MARYVPKASEVEAVQFTLKPLMTVNVKTGVEIEDPEKVERAGLIKRTVVRDGHSAVEYAFEGVQGIESVREGDYIVTGKGGKYAVPKDDFEELYEPKKHER